MSETSYKTTQERIDNLLPELQYQVTWFKDDVIVRTVKGPADHEEFRRIMEVVYDEEFDEESYEYAGGIVQGEDDGDEEEKFCICGNPIKYDYYIRRIDSPDDVFRVGSECIKYFLGSEEGRKVGKKKCLNCDDFVLDRRFTAGKQDFCSDECMIGYRTRECSRCDKPFYATEEWKNVCLSCYRASCRKCLFCKKPFYAKDERKTACLKCYKHRISNKLCLGCSSSVSGTYQYCWKCFIDRKQQSATNG